MTATRPGLAACIGIGLTLSVLCSAACGDDAEEKREAAQRAFEDGGALELSGQWVSNDFVCGPARLRELVWIDQVDREVTAVKVTGDDCVPAGYVSFAGQLPRANLTARDLPLSFPVEGYSGEEGRPDTIAVMAAGEARVTAPDLIQLIFANVSLRLTRSDEAPSDTPDEPTAGPRRRPGGEPEEPEAGSEEQPSASGAGGRSRGRAGSGGEAGRAETGAAGRSGSGGAGATADAPDASVDGGDAGPDAGSECPGPFYEGASCDHIAQCGCAADENCRFDNFEAPSCWPAGPLGDGEACTLDSECGAGFVCTVEGCGRMCNDASQCNGGACVQVVVAQSEAEIDGLFVCNDLCDPVLPRSCFQSSTLTGTQCEPCGAGKECVPGEDVATCETVGVLEVNPPGTACTEASECYGGTCYDDGCRPWCRDDSDCAATESCMSSVGLFAAEGDPIGACVPASSI